MNVEMNKINPKTRAIVCQFPYLFDSTEIQVFFEQITEETNRKPPFVQNSAILCWLYAVFHIEIRPNLYPDRKKKHIGVISAFKTK